MVRLFMACGSLLCFQFVEVAFQNSERAHFNLDSISARVSAATARLLPNLLADSPDPDAALNLFERLTQEASRELLELLDRRPFLVDYAIAIFGHSQYLGEALIQNPDLLPSFASPQALDRSFGRDDYRERLRRFRGRASEPEAAMSLARFKKREYIRIMLRDVLGIAALAEVTAEISALSDILIESALEVSSAAMRGRYGAPRVRGSNGRLHDAPFAVLSLGKLGGNELNYNSDVDLMFLFAEGAAVSSALPEREYFIRLAQRIAEMLSQPTREGAILRIDLRLRPQGKEGETAISLAHALRYYEERADDWELQALIKARHSAGDVTIAREFIHGVEHRVYRSGLNFRAIETALVSQRRISARRRQQQAARRGDSCIDVKVDRGGIRDIEFLVQCLQRVYGGEEEWLRSGGTLFSLQKLHDKSHISGKDFHELTQAYEFLRRLEHRLQLRRGQQTHRLPQSPEQLESVARSLGTRAGGTPIGDAQALLAQLKQHMENVSAIYQRVVHAQHSIQQRVQAPPVLTLQPARAAEVFREDSYSQLLHRLGMDSPVLYQLAARRDLSTHSRRNLQRFLNSALTSSERYAAIVRHAPALEKALALFENSDYLSDVLIRYPDEISTIAEISETPRPRADAGLPLESAAIAPRPDATLSFAASAVPSYHEKLALIRRHYRRQTFADNASDLLAPRPVFDSLASATAAAEGAIATALEIARSRGGAGDGKEANLAVLALGRLGTSEFDLGSDADLLFVRNSQDDPILAKRLAEQVVDILAAYTQEGTVFAVDARLRPLGGEGELVNTPAMLQSYFSSGGEAQAWEALTFTKLRYLAGDKRLGEQVSAQIANSLGRFAQSEDFLPRVREMRQRLVHTGGSSEVNFKTSPGGFYDVDFIVAHRFVKHRLALPGANTRERLRHLATHNLLDDADCATLEYAAELLRAVDHAVRLVSGRSRSTLPAAEHLRSSIEQLAARILDTEFEGALSAELERTFVSVRALYERLMR